MARLLLDHNVPVGLRRILAGHDVTLARQIGLAQVGNGILIAAAEAEGFDMLVTGDKNLAHQQNLAGRAISILILGTNHWRTIRRQADAIARAVAELPPGSVLQLDFTRSAPRA